MVNKKELADAMRKWLNHTRIVIDKSKGPYYKQGHILESVTRTYDLYTMVKRNCNEYSLKKLQELIRMNEKHLRNILPCETNASYESSLNNLEMILAMAKNTNA